MEGLDDLARVLFPGNKTHQRLFLAIFVEIKWAPGQFLPNLTPVARQQQISERTLETVRAKMRRFGIIDHVSRFSKHYGYREGWVFSRRMDQSVLKLAKLLAKLREPCDDVQRQKDQDALRYL
jgi:hypothetical protein